MWDASSSARALAIMLVAVLVFLPVVLAYTAWVFHVTQSLPPTPPQGRGPAQH